MYAEVCDSRKCALFVLSGGYNNERNSDEGKLHVILEFYVRMSF